MLAIGNKRDLVGIMQSIQHLNDRAAALCKGATRGKKAAPRKLAGDAKSLATGMETSIAQIHSWLKVARTSHGATLERIRRLHDGYTQILRDDFGTVTETPQFPTPQDVLAQKPAVARMARAATARLADGPIRVHVLARLQTWFQTFERERLLAKVQEAARKEDALQDEMDRFIFAEGLFPITHCEATGGSLDTFVDEHRDQFVEAERSQQPGVLIELKQAMESVTEAQLNALIGSAKAQARAYSSQLQSNPRWQHHRVFVVVVYAGDKRFVALEDDGVTLIYLGNAKPHDAKPLGSVNT